MSLRGTSKRGNKYRQNYVLVTVANVYFCERDDLLITWDSLRGRCEKISAQTIFFFFFFVSTNQPSTREITVSNRKTFCTVFTSTNIPRNPLFPDISPFFFLFSFLFALKLGFFFSAPIFRCFQLCSFFLFFLAPF